MLRRAIFLQEVIHRIKLFGRVARARAGWECAMLEALRKIRTQEAGHAVKMARIRACNMALYFAIMPIVSFITFAVVPPRRRQRGAVTRTC
jgi:hypothetical protein